MTDRDKTGALSRFVEDFASSLVESGVPRMPARVFAALMMADDGRLTAAELAERLQASPAAISGAVRYLTQVKLVTRGREPGSRRDHFLVEHEVFYRATASRDSLLVHWIDRCNEGIAVAGAGTDAADRLAEMRDFLAFMMTELAGMLQRWEQHRQAQLQAPSGRS